MTYTVHPIANGEYKWGVFDPEGWQVSRHKTEAEAKAEAQRLNERKK